MESHLTSGIPHLVVKNGQKGPKSAYLEEVDFSPFWPFLTSKFGLPEVKYDSKMPTEAKQVRKVE